MTLKGFIRAGIASISILVCASAQADVITIIRDGKTYRCEETPRDPNGALECVEKAYRGPFTRDEATRLCAGARNVVPVDCALEAYRGPFTKEESIRLCRRASSLGPVECANEAYRGPFTKDESLRLCSDDGDRARAECARRAYQGPYTKEEAIRICRGDGAALLIQSFKLMEGSRDVRDEAARLKELKSRGNGTN